MRQWLFLIQIIYTEKTIDLKINLASCKRVIDRIQTFKRKICYLFARTSFIFNFHKLITCNCKITRLFKITVVNLSCINVNSVQIWRWIDFLFLRKPFDCRTVYFGYRITLIPISSPSLIHKWAAALKNLLFRKLLQCLLDSITDVMTLKRIVYQSLFLYDRALVALIQPLLLLIWFVCLTFTAVAII